MQTQKKNQPKKGKALTEALAEGTRIGKAPADKPTPKFKTIDEFCAHYAMLLPKDETLHQLLNIYFMAWSSEQMDSSTKQERAEYGFIYNILRELLAFIDENKPVLNLKAA